ncbi:GntR family transcriptional regulator [Nonomuraea diastatica]|uniref:GntR family transcriptional regulator n=1 Tax=Nonomuraea diastatica TaxID=1848329 RepID=A0A4R4WQH5_9ACTN|nr:GntR family transcriptional regulator [Nonomuraea diastatica]TDD19713.1 GntR family transcriptional regulator [Nonomuraea diastatica]
MDFGDSIDRPPPLRAAVYQRVVSLVTAGELKPGQAVTEAELSRTLGVSRTPVREALLRLEAEGVLDSTPARGFTVRPLRPAEAAEIYPILATLERLAVSTSPARALDLAALRTIDAELLAASDPAQRWRLDTAFHDTIVSACPNASLRTLIHALRVRIARYELAFMRDGDRESHAAPLHEQILAAFGDADLARAADLVGRNWEGSRTLVLDWLDQQ